MGNAYLQFELTRLKNDGHFEDDNTDVIRLVKKASAQLFREATIASTGGSEIEVNMRWNPFLLVLELQKVKIVN